mmetsp:Transcript_17641/g.29799  ORF Transcript_17641/g.29799 Transcript_17641/m.29799 type:complete len:229 (+) Transcript_17641:763-1449(+)
MFLEKVGAFPERLKNMHFVYALVVRAVNRIHDQLVTHDYTTGVCYEQDQMTQAHMSELLTRTIGECGLAFNETQLFRGIGHDLEQQALMSELRDRFYNISRIFDCIGCDKCRFNGKVQIKGLGTAMKILFASEHELGKELEKQEIIALVQLLHRLSESLTYYQEFRELEKQGLFFASLVKHTSSYLAIVLVFILSKLIELKLLTPKHHPEPSVHPHPEAKGEQGPREK